MEKELRENLNRLIPEYVSNNTEDMLKRVKRRLARRVLGLEIGQMRSQRGSRSRRNIQVEKELAEGTQSAEDACSDESDSSVPSLDELGQMIQAERAIASFSCGGTIPIAVDTVDAGRKSNTASPPVNIFSGKKDDVAAHKVVLPVDASIHGTGPFTLQRLVADCEPASFGKGAQDVIDLEYRKAGKLNTDQFATSFHPADFGILDHVGQVLLPSISREVDNQLGCRRIKAELYKLNVYCGPSGLFRKHVDTPRDASQIGSLVVCLPSKFTGGILNVEHHGHKVTFDWSDKSDTTIHWAAFYSDCEHEIETITHGDRITLTYNLYVAEPIGGRITGYTTVIEPRTYSIYGWIKNLLANDNFMENGGILGFGCSHAYAHSSDLADTHLPRALKGADLVLYSVLLSLGIKLSILPVLDDISDHRAGSPCGSPLIGDYLGSDPDILTPADLSITKCEDTEQRWKELYKEREESVPYYGRASGSGMDKVGTHRHSYEISRFHEHEEYNRAVDDLWPSLDIPGITWVTSLRHGEMAFSFVAYGNEASIKTLYSRVAILAVIPPAQERGDIARQ